MVKNIKHKTPSLQKVDLKERQLPFALRSWHKIMPVGVRTLQLSIKPNSTARNTQYKEEIRAAGTGSDFLRY